jgi:hypothetical protein
MKKAIPALFLLSFLAAGPALAQGTASTTVPASRPLLHTVKEKVQAVRERVADRQASSTARVMTVKEDVAKRLVKHAGYVLAATTDRLEKIATRLESRIGKEKAGGADISSAESFFAEARTELEAARATLADFASLDVSSAKLADDVKVLRSAAAAVKEHLKAARQALIRSVQALEPSARGNATSTSAQ